MAKSTQRFDFTKDLEVNDRFDFTKDDGESYNKIQADLKWDSELDLDACAFLVGEDGIIEDDANFVYYKSKLRWLPSNSRWKDPSLREDVDVTEGKFQPFDKQLYRTGKIWRQNTLPVSLDGALIGSWDDPGNEAEEDESGETMHVILDKVGENVTEIIFCVSIHPNPSLEIPVDQQTFDKVKNAKIEISDEETGNILCAFNLKNEFKGKTAVEIGRLSLNEDGEWTFVALAEGHDGGIQTLAEIYT